MQPASPRPPARSWWAAGAAVGRSALLPILRRACRDVERFIFCATTGRSGSATLAAVLARGEHVLSTHEPFPVMNSHVLVAAANGRTRTVKHAWKRLKLPTILSDARGQRIYAETNHQFVKVFPDLALEEFGARLAVIHLVRKPLAVAQSLHALGQIPGNPTASRWLLDPDAPTNVIPFQIARESGLNHPLQRCLWYCLETEARAEAFRRRLPPECTWIDIDIEELNTREGLQRLDDSLNLRFGGAALDVAPPLENRKAGRGGEARRVPDEDAARLQREFTDAYDEAISLLNIASMARAKSAS
jgi:hypothetical protein